MSARQRPQIGYNTRSRYQAKPTPRRKPKRKFYVILGAAVGAIALLLVVLLQIRPLVAVEWASAEFDASFDMLVVRDEIVYEGKNYGKTKYVAVEGQRANEGDLIAEVYEWGYNDETLSKLLDLQKKILKYQVDERRAGIIDEKLTEINTRIDDKAREIQQAVFEDNHAVMLGLERNMESLLKERMEYLKSVTVPDDELRSYYTSEAEMLTLFAQWRSQLVANESGMVSFYFDGCEPLMAKQNIGSFTRAGLEEVFAGKTVETPEKDQAYAPLYRMVNENEWYVVLLSDKRIPEMHVGNSFSIVFDDYLETQYTGIVYDVTVLEQNDGFVYTIMIQDNIGPLLGERRVRARLYGVQEALRIPKSSIMTIERADFVETADGEYVPVVVVAQDKDYVLIKNIEGQPGLEIGQQIVK